jgi:hypothetical protein
MPSLNVPSVMILAKQSPPVANAFTDRMIDLARWCRPSLQQAQHSNTLLKTGMVRFCFSMTITSRWKATPSIARSAPSPYNERTRSSRATTQAHKTGRCSRHSSRPVSSTKSNRAATSQVSSRSSSTAISRNTSTNCYRGSSKPDATLTVYVPVNSLT